MRHQKRLCVEVVGARNLESSQSVDAYCVVTLCDVKPRKRHGSVRLAASPSFRSPTVAASNCPTWSYAAEFVVPARPASVRLRVQIFSEKNFFFDMFPSSSSSSLSDEDDVARRTDQAASEQERKVGLGAAKPNIVVTGGKGIHDSDSDDVVTLSEEEDEEDEFSGEEDVWPVIEEHSLVAAESIEDEMLGFVEINSSLLSKPARVVTDSWYSLGGTRSGEVRIRTIWYERAKRALTAQDRETLFNEHLRRSVAKSMSDFYGFTIPESAREDWVHLRSYQDCREERRVEDWTRLYGTQFPERLRRCSYKEKDTEEKALLVELARAGIPRHLRERAYMNLSGASEKQSNAGPNYYAGLVREADSTETETFRQIELDIDRTFGHSGTAICSQSGRDQLRRILRAYSLRNPSVGYCQGLNFIVAFLMLMADEEAVFWLLSVFCEDLYPGYYSPDMVDIQRDMLVLKWLIADELPRLDEFTSEVGLPLELLGSQWLLCLFTTTFPSETVFRIFDCIFIEGSSFVFPVIMTHLRRLEPTLLGLDEFHGVLSSIKDAENACIDGDLFMAAVCKEAANISATRIQLLREEHCGSVRSEMERAERARAFNQQLAVVYQIPAFSNYAAGLLRFFHDEAEVSSRSDVAFVLTMLCHGLVWLAEHSKRWQR
ncbi:Growth hormone-regulated TBC protein 1 [Phytophthora ramorum]|uniref:Growth hormone-regulated TBC protein 1 n=1 Tax=Phytophthora ramorum TaxID=164328 RepID=UPI00309FA54D|nr:Growth hormone-regulated TBC protein 1 [Phytophthora ramorum]